MDIRQLRYFIAIVETGSFSRAAIRVNVAQPALSQHVLAMEAELGVSLLLRTARGVTPTEEGRRLLDEARTIQARFACLGNHVRGHGTLPVGQVRFGMPGTVSDQLGLPLIEAVQGNFPNINLRITEGMSGFVLDWLRANVIDLALLFDNADTTGLIQHETLTEEIVLFGATGCDVAPKGKNITLRRALELPLVVPSPHHGLRQLIDSSAHSIRARVDPRVEVDSFRQIKQLVAHGKVLGLLPAVAIKEELMAGSLRFWQLTQPKIKRRVILACRADSPLSSASRAVAQTGWTLLQDKVKSGAWQAQWTGAEKLHLR